MSDARFDGISNVAARGRAAIDALYQKQCTERSCFTRIDLDRILCAVMVACERETGQHIHGDYRVAWIRDGGEAAARALMVPDGTLEDGVELFGAELLEAYYHCAAGH